MLHYREDLRPLCFHAVYFGALVFAWQWSASFWVDTALVLGLCALAFQGALQTHNSIHHPVFTVRWMNKVYQVVLTLIYGHPVSNFVPGHNLSHHSHTQSEHDVLRTNKARLPHHFLNLLFYFFRVAPDIIRAEWVYNREIREHHPRWFRQMLLEASILWGVTGWLLYVDWRKALLFWVVPHIYAQWGTVTMNLLQHDGCEHDSRWNHSRNFTDPLLNWFFFNNGFHSIHHDHPGLHWSRLREAHDEEIAPHIHPSLEQSSIFAFAFRFFVLNQRQTFEGEPVSLPPEGTDQLWIPHPEETPRAFGAESYETSVSPSTSSLLPQAIPAPNRSV